MRKLKDSGIEWIDEIPLDWTVKPLKWMVKFGKGLPITKDNLIEQGVPVVSYGQIHSKTNNGTHLQDDLIRFVSETYLESNPLSLGKKGDIFFADTSEDYAGIGNAVLVDIDIPVFAGYHTIIVRPDDQSYSRYLAYLFLTDAWRSQLCSRASGIKVFSITQGLLKKTTVILPPAEKVVAMTDYLDRRCSQIDAIIARQQEVIEKLKVYKLSVITEAVTKGLNPDVPIKDSGVKWIGEIPAHWAIHKFCWDYSAMLGKMLDAKRITGEHLHPYIKNADVQWDSINFEGLDEMDFSDEEKERYTISPGDLMVCEGGEIGKCAIVPDDIPEDIYYQKALHRVRKRYSDSGNIYFLSKVIYCMAKNNCLNTSPEKATIAHLPGDALSQLRIPAPPISEQDQIAEYLNNKCMEIDRLSVRKQETIDKLIEYKKSLIYEIVTGKKEV